MRILVGLGLLFGLLIVPMLALALDAGTATTAVVVVVDPNAGGADTVAQAVSLLVLAFKSRHWMLAAGLSLTVFVVVARLFNFAKLLPDAYVPWATMGLATLASVAVGIQAHQSWDQIMVTGLSVGAAAIGGWETVGKLVRNTVRKTTAVPPDAPPSPPAGGS